MWRQLSGQKAWDVLSLQLYQGSWFRVGVDRIDEEDSLGSLDVREQVEPPCASVEKIQMRLEVPPVSETLKGRDPEAVVTHEGVTHTDDDGLRDRDFTHPRIECRSGRSARR